MGANIIKLKSVKDNDNKPLTPLQKKLLNGPTMTPEEVKHYEKLYPWLKKYKDE